jgi:hypothetical protein
VLDGVDVCHTCDVRCCIEPHHLFNGTRLDNMQDAAKKGRTLGGQQRVAISRATVPRGENWQRRHAGTMSCGVQHSDIMKMVAPRGADHYAAKLTDDDVREIRRLATTGMLQREIAALFNIERVEANRIINRKRWAHVV